MPGPADMTALPGPELNPGPEDIAPGPEERMAPGPEESAGPGPALIVTLIGSTAGVGVGCGLGVRSAAVVTRIRVSKFQLVNFQRNIAPKFRTYAIHQSTAILNQAHH